MEKTTNEDTPKRFISILSDYGFKVTFGNESDTTFLRKAIQLIIKSVVPIKEVQFEKNEFSALTKDGRSGIFDLTCIDENEKVYIVEMQLTNFKHFIHRGKFYAFHRLNRMVKKGNYRFDDLKQIYIISFLSGRTFKSKEFHQIGTIKNQHGELMDQQITHIIIELGKWNKKESELKTDLDKLLYIMKFTDSATINEELPKLSSEQWIEAMIKELDKRDMPPEKLIAIEMALARQGSMLAAEEANIRKAREEERKKAKKRRDFERKQAQLELEKEKQLTQQTQLKLEEGAIKLLALGTMTPSQISTILNLPIATVKRLDKKRKRDDLKKK